MEAKPPANPKPHRNDPCPCGSGEKYKKCCEGKTPRQSMVYFGFERPTVNRIQTLRDGRVIFYDEDGPVTPIASLVETSYVGKARTKVITRAPTDEDPRLRNPSLILFDYDLICVVDTNTKSIDGVKCSVVCLGLFTSKVEGVRGTVSPVDSTVFRLPDDCDSPERRGWVAAIEYISETRNPPPSTKVAIVVDSEMNSLRKINTLKEPVHGKTMLPAGFTLIFATADKKDTIQNRLIRQCDEEASKALAQLEGQARKSHDNTQQE